MTKDRDFKTLVRERMTKTGESYAAARASLRSGGGARDPEKSATDAPRRFTIPDWPMTGPVSRLRGTLELGTPGADSYIEVTADDVFVHMSDDTGCVLPRDAIVDVRRCDGLQLFAGLRREAHVHILYGGGGSVVAMKLDRDADIWAAGSHDTVRELRVGVDDADALVALLQA
jgi:hypothetical protein